MLDAFVELAGGLDHPEGVTIGPDGLVYAGGEAGQIYRIGEDGSVTELASTGGLLYGVTLDGDLNVYACDFGNASVARITPSGDVSTYSTGTADRPMRVPNFAAFDDDGNLYVTDSGEWGADDGLIYRIAPDGTTTVWTDGPSRFPNGCCLSADGGSLYVVESHGRAIARIAIADDGSAGPAEQIADLTGSQPNGIALAIDGSLIVGHYRPDRRVDPSPGRFRRGARRGPRRRDAEPAREHRVSGRGSERDRGLEPRRLELDEGGCRHDRRSVAIPEARAVARAGSAHFQAAARPGVHGTSESHSVASGYSDSGVPSGATVNSTVASERA